MRRRFHSAALAAIFLLAWAAVPAAEVETPGEINRRAYELSREGQGALLRGEERAAYDKFIAAAELYGKIAEKFPDWNPMAVALAKAQAEASAAALRVEVFRLPEGWLRIGGELAREGKRFAEGEALAGSVVKSQEDRYEVESFLVEFARDGPLLGARCGCPDFRYRGIKYGYPCKHIWAVVIKEKLLE